MRHRCFDFPVSAESFRLIPPVAMHAAAPGWAAKFPQFDTVIGYSDLGHVFLSNADNECGVLHPYKAAAKSYGTFPDHETFADQVSMASARSSRPCSAISSSATTTVCGGST